MKAILMSEVQESGPNRMVDAIQPQATLQTAVLFLVFNRPDTTAKVFEAISKAKPPRLYVAADGARVDREGEARKVAIVRAIATSVNWPCQVKTLFRENNLGCKKAVSEGISWFFEQEEQGIILEDDCLPHPDFFYFCENLLHHYAENEKIWVITGNNFQNGVKRGDASYYYSRYNHVWGWATWRRAWEKADMDIKFWPKWKTSRNWRARWLDRAERRYWENIFDKTFSSKIDTWDYSWTASVWYCGGLTVTPNVNLVNNIGFGPDATHTKSTNSPLGGMATHALGELKHPKSVSQDSEADAHVFEHVFGGKHHRFPRSFLRIPRSVGGAALRAIKRITT